MWFSYVFFQASLPQHSCGHDFCQKSESALGSILPPWDGYFIPGEGKKMVVYSFLGIRQESFKLEGNVVNTTQEEPAHSECADTLGEKSKRVWQASDSITKHFKVKNKLCNTKKSIFPPLTPGQMPCLKSASSTKKNCVHKYFTSFPQTVTFFVLEK